MKSTRIRILTIGAAVMLAMAAAIAQGMHGHGGPGGPGGDFHHMLRQLDLTSAQHTQVKAIFAKEKPAMEPLMQQMRQNHDAHFRDELGLRSRSSRRSIVRADRGSRAQKLFAQHLSLRRPGQMPEQPDNPKRKSFRSIPKLFLFTVFHKRLPDLR